MNLKDIEKIVKIMDDHGLSQFKLEQDDTKLELKKSGDLDVDAIQRLMASAPAPVYSAPPQQAAMAAPVGEAASGEAAGLPAGVEEITSPMVGTFYVAEKPEADPFVKVGDRVESETTVCMVEAMKVFNEIKAEISGEIVEILVDNGTPVQYGEPLFLVKKA